jgi:TPR repeat protein
MVISYKKYEVWSTDSYLAGIRRGDLCPVILKNRRHIIVEQLPKMITNTDIDQYAYAYFLVCYGDNDQTKHIFPIVKKLIANNFPLAYNLYGIMLWHGIGVSQNKFLAVEYYQKAVKENSAFGKYNLGLLMINGDGMYAPKNVEKGMELVREAAFSGYADALSFIGLAYYLGKHGYPVSKLDAFDFFTTGSYQDDIKCKYYLSIMYEKGEGYTDKDPKKAFELRLKCAYLEDVSSMMYVGREYFLGQIVEKKDETAFYYFKEAAEAGNSEGMYYTGYFYYHGIGVCGDLNLGIRWLEKAKNNGNKEAAEELRKIRR